MLALIVAAPTLAIAAPDRVESVVPLPPSLNGQAPRQREAAPEPAQETQPAASTPRESEPNSNFSVKGALDKVFAASDMQISDRLREIVTGKQMERRIDRAPERQAIETFYAARNYAPLWIADGQLDARAKSVIAQLENAAADGLDPADYLVPEFGVAERRGAGRRRHQAHQFGCSPMPATWRPAASRRTGCWRKSITAITRRRRPISCAKSPRPPMPARRSKASIRRMTVSGR